MTFFFWSSPDFEREIGHHAVRFQGSVETATKLLGFGRLARVKKRCTTPTDRLKKFNILLIRYSKQHYVFVREFILMPYFLALP